MTRRTDSHTVVCRIIAAGAPKYDVMQVLWRPFLTDPTASIPSKHIAPYRGSESLLVAFLASLTSRPTLWLGEA